jgi:hypothetical protein
MADLRYDQMMSGTGALRQFVPKVARLGSRAAFGYAPLVLGQTALTCASELGPMSDSDKEQLVSDMLADMCGLIGKTIALIPAEHDDERLSACAFVLDQINEVVKRMVSADRTEH